MRTHTKFGIKIFEIDFVIEIKWYLTFWPRPRGRGQKNCYVARPIHVSNSHTKFGWISSNGLGGGSITDGQTDGGDNNIPFAFLKKRGDNKQGKVKTCLSVFRQVMVRKRAKIRNWYNQAPQLSQDTQAKFLMNSE